MVEEEEEKEAKGVGLEATSKGEIVSREEDRGVSCFVIFKCCPLRHRSLIPRHACARSLHLIREETKEAPAHTSLFFFHLSLRAFSLFFFVFLSLSRCD